MKTNEKLPEQKETIGDLFSYKEICHLQSLLNYSDIKFFADLTYPIIQRELELKIQTLQKYLNTIKDYDNKNKVEQNVNN